MFPFSSRVVPSFAVRCRYSPSSLFVAARRVSEAKSYTSRLLLVATLFNTSKSSPSWFCSSSVFMSLRMISKII